MKPWIGYVATRLPLACCVAALGTACVVFQARIRGAEAALSAQTLRAVLGQHAVAFPGYADLLVRNTPTRWVGLHIALSCSSALLLPGLCVVTLVLLALRRLSGWGPMLALPGAAVVFTLCNLARIVALADVAAGWGAGRVFHFAHTWAGTAATLLAATLSVATYLALLGLGRDYPTRQKPEQADA